MLWRLLPAARMWPVPLGFLLAVVAGAAGSKAVLGGYAQAAARFASGGWDWASLAAQLPDLGPASLLLLGTIGAIAKDPAHIETLLVVSGAFIVALSALFCRPTFALALNPGLILASALLGPFELAAAALVFGAARALAQNRLALAWIAALGAFAFTPVGIVIVALVAFAPLLYAGQEREQAWRSTLRGVLAGGAILTLLCGRFASLHPVEGLAWLFAHYPNGFTSFHFNSAGALNLHALFGAMWRPDSTAQWGYLLFAGTAAMIVLRFIRARRPQDAPLAAFLLLFAVFIFPPRISAAQLAYAVMLAPLLVRFDRKYLVVGATLATSLAINALLLTSRTSIPLLDHGLALVNIACFFYVAYRYLGNVLPAADNLAGENAAAPGVIQSGAAQPRSGVIQSGAAQPRSRRTDHDEPPAPAMSALDYAAVTALMTIFLACAYVQFWEPSTKIFDEIYYVRAGAEYLQHTEIFESTHPPLTKLVIMLSMLVAGDHPFGWRLFNIIIGALQIGVVYAFARRWLRSRAFAAVAAAVVTFDGFHLAQSRIATPEITVAFFTILTLYCFYRFWTAGSAPGVGVRVVPHRIARVAGSAMAGAACAALLFPSTSLNARIVAGVYFALCSYAVVTWLVTRIVHSRDAAQRDSARWFWYTALAMGCLAACKWNGLFTFAALVLIFVFVHLYARIRGRASWGRFAGIASEAFVPTMLAAGATIYLATYIPYFSLGHGLDEFLQLQAGMYRYHSTLVFTHPYTSPWWKWPLIMRPIAYYLNDTSFKGSACCIAIILALPNPVTWLLGLISVPYTGITGWIERNKGALLIVTAYFVQWLPWAFSPRLAFEYHFFPNAALIALADAYLLQRLWERRSLRVPIAAYGACAFAAFVYFYPIVTGMTISLAAYHQRMLEWLIGSLWI